MVDAADDGVGAPFAGVNAAGQPKASMERLSLLTVGTLQSNWKTAVTTRGFDPGPVILGTPGFLNGTVGSSSSSLSPSSIGRCDKCVSCGIGPEGLLNCTQSKCTALGDCTFRAGKFTQCVPDSVKCGSSASSSSAVGLVYCCSGANQCVQGQGQYLENCDAHFDTFQPGPGLDWGMSCPAILCMQSWPTPIAVSSVSSAAAVGGVCPVTVCSEGGDAFCAPQGKRCFGLQEFPCVDCR